MPGARPARAQAPTNAYSAPAYSGGQASSRGGYAPTGGGWGGSGVGGRGTPARCGGQITAAFTWSGPAPAPRSAIATETSRVSCYADCAQCALDGPPSASCADGLGDTAQFSPAYVSPGEECAAGSLSGTRYSVQGGGAVPLTCSPSASAFTPDDSPSTASVAYAASLSPVTINPGGMAIQDSSGNWHILIGQQCAPSLAGIPPGLANCVSNLQWKATGNTLQGWTGANGGPTAVIQGAANPYQFTQTSTSTTGPSWYWSDTALTETITCAATVTPPTGQGAAFPVTATQNVIIDVPTYSEADAGGVTRIDNTYPPLPGVYALWAGGPSGATTNGSSWQDGVTRPPLYANEGTDGVWAHLQIITVNGTKTVNGTAVNLPNAGSTGLDGKFPYSSHGDALDNGNTPTEGDSPGVGLDDNATNYSLNYSWDLYVMYDPPGATSIWVPLTKLTWTWKPNVNEPSDAFGQKTWTAWSPAMAPGGNPSVPPSGTRFITEPTWNQVISGNY